MTTAPMSEYFSMMGIMKGPSLLRWKEGIASKYGMKGMSLEEQTKM